MFSLYSRFNLLAIIFALTKVSSSTQLCVYKSSTCTKKSLCVNAPEKCVLADKRAILTVFKFKSNKRFSTEDLGNTDFKGGLLDVIQVELLKMKVSRNNVSF
jgi:hypothetical protein